MYEKKPDTNSALHGLDPGAAGCDGQRLRRIESDDNPGTPAGITQTGTTQAGQQTTTQKTTTKTTAGQAATTAGKNPVLIDAITRYMDVKQVSYEALSNKMQADPSQAVNIFGLMGVAAMDLSILPITYLAGLQALQDVPGWAGSLFMIKGTGKIDKNGSKYAFQATSTDPQNPFEFKGEYDEQTDSMQYTMSENGKEQLYFEYVRSGEGYASQYYTFPESADDKPDNNLIMVYTIGKEIYVGYKSAAEKPKPIYGTKPATRKDFIKDCTDKYILENDQVTVETAP